MRIGFLGAGVIMRQGMDVRGLNTAATLWCTAAVGILAGLNYTLMAILTAALLLCGLTTRVKSILEIARLNTVFSVHADRNAALGA